MRSALARWCALPATGGPCTCGDRIDRMLATDRQGHAGAHPTVQSSGGTSKASPVATSIPANHASRPLGRLLGPFSLAGVGRTRSITLSWQPEPSFFTPQVVVVIDPLVTQSGLVHDPLQIVHDRVYEPYGACGFGACTTRRRNHVHRDLEHLGPRVADRAPPHREVVDVAGRSRGLRGGPRLRPTAIRARTPASAD